MTNTFYAFSGGIAKDPIIPVALGGLVKHVRMSATIGQTRAGDSVVGWGQKQNTQSARDFAGKNGLDYLSLEDGFIGYLGHPSLDQRRLSVICDRRGIYYDARCESDLEHLLNHFEEWYTADHRERAEAIRSRLVANNISKYNHGWAELPEGLRDGHKERVLIVDQVRGDLSIEKGMAGPQDFEAMLAAALKRHPEAQVWLKVHPDVLSGAKKGHFQLQRLDPCVRVIAENIPTYELLSCFAHVYVVTSQLGFEALLAGCRVHVFGVPFYAGWGLTEDHKTIERRRARPDLSVLISASLIEYPRYVDPFFLTKTQIETILDYLEAERAVRRPAGRRVYALGFSIWKRSFLRAFLPHVSSLRFIAKRALQTVKWQAGDQLIIWGRRWDEQLKDLPSDVSVWRVEDGFVRSVGLGSDLRRPNSLVLDGAGIHYDGSCASDLENFLNSHRFTDAQKSRGHRLCQLLVQKRVSKYNVTGQKVDLKSHAGGKKLILAVGQVGGDESLKYGSPNIGSNKEFLESVRTNAPDAFIIYKPHPDVLAGNRDGDETLSGRVSSVDLVVTDADIIDCIDQVDEVHVMTSLTGFEALLRGKTVHTYGQPFYAGWGLTQDRYQIERRTACLTLDELVYGVLCVYGRYVCWPSGQATIPEKIIADFAGRHSKIDDKAIPPILWLKKNLRKAGFLLTALLR